MGTPGGASGIPIAAVSSETLEWRPRAAGMYSRAERERQTGPYEATIAANIAEWEPRMSGADSADVEDAARELVDFDTRAQRRLGSGSPALGPMAAILLRTESASSSQIERLTTSAKQLALAQIGESNKANALTVVGNVHAMEAALRLSDEISESAILEMHRALMLEQAGFPAEDAGRFRTEQVWIGPGTAGPRAADFVAPHHGRVPRAIEDLVSFARRQDLPVLVQVAIAHAQFETIHPFPDGNGRTGRALAQSILRSQGLVRSTTVPISAGLLVDIEGYFEALAAFRDGDAGPIVRGFASASRVAAVTGGRLVDALAAQVEDARAKLAGLRSDAAAWRVLPVLVGQPAVNVRYLTTVLDLGEVTVLRALEALSTRGVVTEITGKARGRVWQHHGILAVLDEYAANIRRMSAR